MVGPSLVQNTLARDRVRNSERRCRHLRWLTPKSVNALRADSRECSRRNCCARTGTHPSSDDHGVAIEVLARERPTLGRRRSALDPMNTRALERHAIVHDRWDSCRSGGAGVRWIRADRHDVTSIVTHGPREVSARENTNDRYRSATGRSANRATSPRVDRRSDRSCPRHRTPTRKEPRLANSGRRLARRRRE